MSVVHKLETWRIVLETALRNQTEVPLAGPIFYSPRLDILDPVSSTLLEVNKALLSRLVKIFHSLWSHAFDARIGYANPDDFRHQLVHWSSSDCICT
jgi:hypothetical protein